MIKVGIIGFGYAAKTFHLPLLECNKQFSLTAISSSQQNLELEGHPQLKVFSTALDLINAQLIDLVIITSPNNTHFELAKAALAADLHVVVEKPMTITTQEAAELCAIAKSRRRILTVFQNRRWDGDYLTVQKILASGLIGKLKIFESHFDRFRPVVRDRWRENAGTGSGIWYDLGPHLVDQAVCLFGAPVAITAQLKMLRENAKNTDYFHVQFHYPSIEVILHSNPYNAAPNPRFQLFGTQGSFVKFGLDPQEEQLKSGMALSHANYGNDQPEHYGQVYTEASDSAVPTLAGAYPNFYQQLAVSINNGDAAPVQPESAILVMQLIEQAVRSSELSKTLIFSTTER